MRGSPLLEWLIVVLGAMVCFLPMKRLTQSTREPRTDVNAHSHTHDHSHGLAGDFVESAWLEIQSSHPPLQIEVYQNGKILWEGEGELNLDADFELRVSDGRSRLDFVFRWPEKVEQAYVELRLEAGEHPLRTWGLWSSGEDKRTWHVQWEDPL